MSPAAAALVSLTLVTGLALVASAAPRLRRPSLPARLDPYLRGLEPQRTRLLNEEQPPLTPFPALERVLRPVVEEAARMVDRWLGGPGKPRTASPATPAPLDARPVLPDAPALR